MTIVGKIFRTVSKLTGTYDIFYSGDATRQAAEQGQAAANAYTTTLTDSINNLFGGLAEKVGTSAGASAASAIPVWVWPAVAIVAVGAIVVVIITGRKGGKNG
jgi:hypothetical protein